MVINACATVLSPVFASMHHKDMGGRQEILQLWNSVTRKSTMLIYPMILFCLFFGDVIMVVLYGYRYANSTKYFRIKILSDFFTIAVFAPLIINIGKVKFYSMVHMVNAAFVVILEFISVKTVNTPIAISYISMLGRLFNIFMLASCVAKYLNIRIYQLFPLEMIAKIVISSSIILFWEHYIIVSKLQIKPWCGVFVAFGIYILLYYIVSLFLKLNYWDIIRPLLIKQK